MSFIFWQGPSPLDGSPVVAVATGDRTPTSNRKTGDMVQTWFLHRDIDPMTANRSGADLAYCGDCALRGNANDRDIGEADDRRCYVILQNAPLKVWQSIRDGLYPVNTDPQAFDGYRIRWGSFGEPCVLPQSVFEPIYFAGDRVQTGYTHQWRDDRFRWLKQYMMASVNSIDEKIEAEDDGWRTYRVGEFAQPGELECPASTTRYVSCSTCGLCNGNQSSRQSIWIKPHGGGGSAYLAKRLIKSLRVLDAHHEKEVCAQ